MADVQEVFNILADEVTGAGEAAISRIEGEAAASQAGLIGFSFKDSSGNVVLPQLTADGKIAVTLEGTTGACLTAQGENAGSLTEVAVCTISGQLSKVYNEIECIVSCLRTTRFRVVYVDDANGTPAETELYSVLVGSGQYSISAMLKCATVDTTGGTGDQEFRIYGQNLFLASTMDAALALKEN